MSNKQKADDINAITGKPFSKMTVGEKLIHLCKIVVFFLTFGFAFPNIFSD